MSLSAGQLSQATIMVGCRLIIKYLNGSGECLERATAHYALPPRGNYEYGLPCFTVSFEDSSDTSSTAACAGKWSSLRVLLSYLLVLRRPASHRTEYGRVRVQNPAYLGVRPADGLSVEFEGWATTCRIASVGHSLTRCAPPWRSMRAKAEYSSAPL